MRWQDPCSAVHRARGTVVLAAAGTLAWSGAHWLSLRLADPHRHVHEHGIEHTGVLDGQRRLEALHAYLVPTAVLSLLVLVVGLVVCLRPGGPRATVSARSIVLTAGVSAAVFAIIETAEHAASSSNAPPVALLAVGTAVHALAGVAAAVMSQAALQPPGQRPRPAGVRPWPRQVPVPEWASPPLPRVLLAVLAGRAPPVCA